MDRKYRGIGLIGNETIASIYAVNNGIVDINGTGIYHLFYKNYSHDLLQSAVTLLRVDDTVYYGNKKWKACTHPHHMVPETTGVEAHYRYTDTFVMEEHKLWKKDCVYAYGKNLLVFECEVENRGEEIKKIGCFGYAAVRNDRKITAKCLNNMLEIKTGEACIAMAAAGNGESYLVEDSPTDFAYQAFLDISERKQQKEDIETKCRLGCARGKEVTLAPGEKITYKWYLLFADTEEELLKEVEEHRLENVREEADAYWNNWLNEGIRKAKEEEFASMALTNLVAVKAVIIDGFVPADLTGHYFCNKMPCYYARDSIMVARALLIAGHVKECREIIEYLIGRKRKENGEFFQRYDGNGEPNEGANNNVFHQIDSIGYFCRIIYEYYAKTGEMLASEKLLEELTDVIVHADKKLGMAGPEGGVNEGVFGGAYITSSNMFIYGGMKAAEALFEISGNKEYKEKCKTVCSQLYEGIQSTFNETLQRYDYGYVEYHDHTVRKYDTPQYFGPLYGYPNDENMQKTHQYLLKYASFYEDGIGYSEQEYHHGPWLFNTLACAEYAKLYGDYEQYLQKMKWAKEHCNAYGLLPEAVEADDETHCLINPLSWACAEFAAAYFRGED